MTATSCHKTQTLRQTDRQTDNVPCELLNCVCSRSSVTGRIIKSRGCSSRSFCREVCSRHPTSTSNTSNTSCSSSTDMSCPRYQSVSVSSAHGWFTSQPDCRPATSPVSTHEYWRLYKQSKQTQLNWTDSTAHGWFTSQSPHLYQPPTHLVTRRTKRQKVKTRWMNICMGRVAPPRWVATFFSSLKVVHSFIMHYIYSS